MYKGVINFTSRDCDLDRTPEYWQGESYSERIKTIQAVVQEKTTYLPTKKLQSVREGVFKVPSTITVEQLVDLSKALRRWYKIDCFQIAINRTDNTAHMLFDWIDRETGQSIYYNTSESIILTVFVLRFLNLPKPENTRTWFRYDLLWEYYEDPKIFDHFLDFLKHSRPSKRIYRLAYEMKTFSELLCKGLVK